MYKTLFLLLALSTACHSQTADPSVTRQENPLIPAINQKTELTKVEKYTNLFDYRVIKNSLMQNGYLLERQFAKHPDSIDNDISAEYAILTKNNKTLIKFDRVDHASNTIDIGSFPFLSKTNSQLFISQTAPRAGCHWIVSTKPEFRVLFESIQYDVGRDVFQVLDLDGDDIYELSFESISFYGFESDRLGNVGVPLTEIIFKYDSQAGKYLPANPQLLDFALREIEDQRTKIRRDNKDWQFADVLAVTLRYIYAGRETEAWEVFDQEYNFADKADLKVKIKSVLSNDRTYKYIYSTK